MNGYLWLIAALVLLIVVEEGCFAFLVWKTKRETEAIKLMLRLEMGSNDRREKTEIARHAETIVTIERLTERLMQQVLPPLEAKDEELTDEEKELARKAERAFSDGVSNILNYSIGKDETKP